MNHHFIYSICCLLFFGIQCQDSQAPATSIPIVIIENGVAKRTKTAGKAWLQKEGYLERQGLYNVLYVDQQLVGTTFRLWARLSLAKLEGTTALFTFFDHHFGFDSASGTVPEDRGQLFLFNRTSGHLQKLGAATTHIQAGVPFEFVMEATSTELIFQINGTEITRVARQDFAQPFTGGLGFRPWRNTMRLYDCQLEGNWQDFPPIDYLYGYEQLGYHCFRNPALVQTPSGTLLAFAQGRYEDCYDLGDRDLLVKRSTDQGQSWSPAQVVFDAGTATCTGPTPVVDAQTGQIHLLMTKVDIDYEANNELGLRENGRTVYWTSSTDDGLNWTPPRDISKPTIRPDWDIVATGPGSGIQLAAEAHRGRLVFPCYHRNRVDKGMYAHTIYSDDHGANWQIGQATPSSGVAECQLAELGNGQLILSMRQANESLKTRQIAISIDGGESWQTQRKDTMLLSGACQASVASVINEGVSTVLLANPLSESLREKMTVSASFDAGKTWPIQHLLHRGSAGYSDLLVLDDQTLLCFYEHGRMWTNEGLFLQSVPLSVFQMPIDE
ncbi:MAG: sialidase family protein [Bacteroidota bacterium]